MTPVILIVLLALLLLTALALALFVERLRRQRTLRELWRELATASAGPAQPFDAAMLRDLPDPARRWLAHAIAPGTPLRHVALLRMHGAMLLTEGKPPLPMTAEQVLAPPRGFVWQARAGSGLLRIRGFDCYAHGRGEMRWWVLGLIPAVTGRGPDIDRSAAGRLAGESALVPATLLPRPGVEWEAVDPVTARARVLVNGELVAFTIRVGENSGVQRVVIERWSGDPRNGPVGFLPFVVDFEGEQRLGGYTLPRRITAGWASPGTETATPFFRAELDEVSFR